MMLFNSWQFIFIFLPITIIGCYFLAKHERQQYGIIYLMFASLFFYSWWNPPYILLLGTSIVFNYAIGMQLVTLLSKHHFKGGMTKSLLLFAGVGINLSILGYFKYGGLLNDSIQGVSGLDASSQSILLPLAISFFTFQQVAFLVDCAQGKIKKSDFISYCLFIVFFPQLIAGPIVHFREIVPQFYKGIRIHRRNLAIGSTIFIIGLFKKIVIADNLAGFADSVFDLGQTRFSFTFFEAWLGVLCFTMQIYFDFSAYSDMAVGLARMFGFRLPLNFYSPYKANNIIDFWRRWHITLSRFLRDYLYIPLGGNRKGYLRRHANILITMVLGGLWHGAGLNFMIWGILHGFYLVVNHVWHSAWKWLGVDISRAIWYKAAARALTFLVIAIAWVFFRADSFDGAENILRSLVGINGFSLPESMHGRIGILEQWLIMIGVDFSGDYIVSFRAWATQGVPVLFGAFIIVWFFPNTQQMMLRYKPTIELYQPYFQPIPSRFGWKFSPLYGLFLGLICFIIIKISLTGTTHEFVYYNF